MSKQAAPARAPAAAAPGVSELTVIPSKDAEHGADLAAASSEDLETATSPAGILAAFSVQLDSASAMKAALQSEPAMPYDREGGVMPLTGARMWQQHLRSLPPPSATPMRANGQRAGGGGRAATTRGHVESGTARASSAPPRPPAAHTSTSLAVEQAKSAQKAQVEQRRALIQQMRTQEQLRRQRRAAAGQQSQRRPAKVRPASVGAATAAAAPTPLDQSTVIASLATASPVMVASATAAGRPRPGARVKALPATATRVVAATVGGGAGAFSVAAAGLVERKQAPSAAEDELVQLRDMLKATTHTGQARSDDLTTPQALRTPWGGNAQRYKEASTLARDRTQRHLQPWDRTPHMDVPYLCRGLRPANHSLTEPWAKQAIEVWASASAGLGFSTSGLKKLDDGSRDSDVELFNRRMREDGDKAAATNRPKWDASPFIPMPTKFRGLNTFTHEPWTRDSQSFMLFEDARRAEEAHRLHGRESRASTAMLRHTYMGGALGGVKGGHGGPMHAIEM